MTWREREGRGKDKRELGMAKRRNTQRQPETVKQIKEESSTKVLERD